MSKIHQPKAGFMGLIFLAAIMVEIAGFIIVGSEVGVLATLGLIILSMIAGLVLLRIQSFGLLQTMQKEMAAGRLPDKEMAYGAMMVVGAILLIIPGFVSSTLGILLFIPPFRSFIWQWISKRVRVKTSFHEDFRDTDKNNTTIIDLDADDYHSADPENSPWKKNDDNRYLP